MLPHYRDAGNDTAYGTTMSLAALRSYLDSKGVDSRAWWLKVQTVVLQVCVSMGHWGMTQRKGAGPGPSGMELVVAPNHAWCSGSEQPALLPTHTTKTSTAS